MQNNIVGRETSKKDDHSTNRSEAISVALVPWKPLGVEVFRHENRSPNSGTQSDETFEKLVIRELLAERREFYEVMLEVRNFLLESLKSKTIELNQTKASGPCGEDIEGCEEPQCSKSPAGRICNRRARFIRSFVKGRNKKNSPTRDQQ